MMVNSLDVLILTGTLGAIGIATMLLPSRIKFGFGSVVVLVMLLSSFMQPSLASNDGALLAQRRDAAAGKSDTSSVETQYQGLVFPSHGGEPLSDREITQKIRQDAPEDLKLSVSNGSVRISGNVSSRQTAERIVEDIKAIPGVHEVAYDLGIEG